MKKPAPKAKRTYTRKPKPSIEIPADAIIPGTIDFDPESGDAFAVNPDDQLAVERANEFNGRPKTAELQEPVNEEESDGAARTRLAHSLLLAEQQRDFLSRQVDSLVQRLAGQHVASGSFDMAAAQGFVQKEILPINQVLAQIAAQPQGE